MEQSLNSVGHYSFLPIMWFYNAKNETFAHRKMLGAKTTVALNTHGRREI